MDRVMIVAAVAAGVVAFAGGAARGGAFETYGAPYRTVAMPATGAGSFGLFGDALPDGRLVACTGRSVYLETGPRTGVFTVAAVLDSTLLPPGQSADPSFLRVSPDGQRVAIGLGEGKPVAVIPSAAVLGAGGAAIGTGTPGVKAFNIPHVQAAWRTSGELAITAGSFGAPSRVTLLDVNSSPGAPVNPTIIANIGGASGGVAFDRAGRLYTGNGFDLASGGGASTTGTIKAFSPAQWAAPGGADFEASGTLVGDVLSASGLLFDAEGNLVVGGGDFSDGDAGYLGVIRSTALQQALGGGAAVDRSDSAAFKRLTPSADPFAFYQPVFNPATGELYAGVNDFVTGANTWYATIPAPGAASVGLVVVASAASARRRRT